MTSALEVRDLTRTYGSGAIAVHALRSVSFRIEAGEMICVRGKSGSGKSTLLRQLGLLDLPSDGQVLLDGIDVTRIREGERRQLRLHHLGYVFQEYALLPELTAVENVYLPALMAGDSRRSCKMRGKELLELLELGDRGAHRPFELSGGEQQRVAIARALVNRPEIVFADEPTGNLDVASSEMVMQALVRINHELKVTIVFVSHDPDHDRYARRIILLRDGELATVVPR